MRILYLAHRSPFPPAGGAKVRAFNAIRHLTEKGHEVVVGTMTRDEEEAVQLQGLREHCAEVLSCPVKSTVQGLRMVANLFTSVPSTMGFFYSPGLRELIRKSARARPYDLIICHSSSMGQYVEDFSDTLKVMDFVDMDSQKWLIYAKAKSFPLSLGYWIEGRKLERDEARLARLFDLSLVITEGELEILERLAPGSDFDWFPNGVDADRFAPSEDAYDPDTISFIGRFDYYPNEQAAQWFCDEVMPLLLEQRPNMKLQLVGAEPSAAVRQLGERSGVVVTGTVPEVHPYVHGSVATVAPLLIARGLQNKILESMAMGVPVVASAECAKGVDVVPGEHILSCTDPAEYVQAIIQLAEDAGARERYALAGRQRVLEHLTWKKALERMDASIDRLMNNN